MRTGTAESARSAMQQPDNAAHTRRSNESTAGATHSLSPDVLPHLFRRRLTSNRRRSWTPTTVRSRSWRMRSQRRGRPARTGRRRHMPRCFSGPISAKPGVGRRIPSAAAGVPHQSRSLASRARRHNTTPYDTIQHWGVNSSGIAPICACVPPLACLSVYSGVLHACKPWARGPRARAR